MTRQLKNGSDGNGLPLLLSSVFLSSVGTALLLVCLSTLLFQKTGSVFLASVILVSQWLIAPLTIFATTAATTRFPANRLLPATEILGATVTMAIGLLFELYWIAALLLIPLRGVFEATTKAGRITAIKLMVPEDKLKRAFALDTSFFVVGSGVGALIAATVIERLTLVEVTLLTAMFFVAAALCCIRLRQLPTVEQWNGRVTGVYREFAAILIRNPKALQDFSILTLATVVYQGYHTVARTGFPFEHLSMGIEGPAVLQSVSILGIALGALCVAMLFSHAKQRTSMMIGSSILAGALLQLPWLPSTVIASFACYFLFVFMFEVAFTLSRSQLFSQCKNSEIAIVSNVVNTALTFGVAVFTLSASLLADHFGLFPLSVIVSVVGITGSLLAIALSTKKERVIDAT